MFLLLNDSCFTNDAIVLVAQTSRPDGRLSTASRGNQNYLKKKEKKRTYINWVKRHHIYCYYFHRWIWNHEIEIDETVVPLVRFVQLFTGLQKVLVFCSSLFSLLLFILIYGSSFLLFVISYCYYYCWLSFILSISTSNFVHLPFLSWLRRSSYVCEYELVCTSCIWICSLHVSSWLFVFFSSIQHSIQRWYNRNFIRWMRFYIWTGSMLFVEFAALYYHLNLVNLPIL